MVQCTARTELPAIASVREQHGLLLEIKVARVWTLPGKQAGGNGIDVNKGASNYVYNYVNMQFPCLPRSDCFLTLPSIFVPW